ncbi:MULTISPECIES: serine hydroxymethyltransferase [unclassified Saccharibacter]|uniref:serine hydroxymethyltransferase n=1 Tax=unclassified Saccharibacter TaxID=2648722 RepID=UPI00132BE3D9|nr:MULTISPECIES: serine hydroxymethyltransferase [unclassified Saccharibacter]MXV36331.1 aminotransferase class I/II-fold pyridoxal phosphate-dependent enzyme [Saccharibacter sp. EH611]MXV57190.1 aminotransferase class I/II-fold pyridoxal phosphate-dependent enzyme [Saccharibacter sp. EH70]MXV66450.1 aminotransferase class I/II-fold pyridoxal phosphate-dependent enzyme [Saccharibacter sp. EH60]
MSENASKEALKSFFHDSLKERDSEVATLLNGELKRQQDGIELIASENMTSFAVMEAQGSVLTNKYAEGRPGRRYYGGCVEVDKVENLAIERVKKLFGAEYANVQPHSGANANQAAFMALGKPGDTILGMSLAAGGHLTHGAAPNYSGKWFNAVQYGVRGEDGVLDYEEMEKLAREHKPRIIVAGGSAYPRKIDFARFRRIADEVGASLMVDMAHYAGLVAAGLYPNPVPYADITTSTTHKTLQGPRGGIILTNDPELFKKINSAVFPGLQGGPLMHVIAGKAVAFGDALKDEFKTYQQRVLNNARALADELSKRGFDIITEGTDSHIVLVDLRPKKVTGKFAEALMERAGITANKNAVPFDPEKPFVTSGVRLGSPAATARGFGEAEFREIARMIDEVLTAGEDDTATIERVRNDVLALCHRFPIYDRASA